MVTDEGIRRASKAVGTIAGAAIPLPFTSIPGRKAGEKLGEKLVAKRNAGRTHNSPSPSCRDIFTDLSDHINMKHIWEKSTDLTPMERQRYIQGVSKEIDDLYDKMMVCECKANRCKEI